MAYSRNDIQTQNVNTYPNNNSGAITPASVKDFNANFIGRLTHGGKCKCGCSFL
jgi:hypothetical protein